jgi:hypothetical protein
MGSVWEREEGGSSWALDVAREQVMNLLVRYNTFRATLYVS